MGILAQTIFLDLALAILFAETLLIFLEALLELHRNIPQLLEGGGLTELSAQIGMDRQTGVEELEEMALDHTGTGRADIAADGEVLFRHLPRIGRHVTLGKDSGVVQVPFCAHDRIHTGVVNASLDVFVIQNVAVRHHRNLEGFFDGLDLVPVGQSRLVALLLAQTAMHSQHLRARLFDHLGILDRLFDSREDADLDRDRHSELLVQQRHHLFNQLPLVLQIRAIVTPLRNVLRTAQVEIDTIAVLLDELGRLQERGRIIGTKLG